MKHIFILCYRLCMIPSLILYRLLTRAQSATFIIDHSLAGKRDCTYLATFIAATTILKKKARIFKFLC